MPTPDGISNEDWDDIHECAAEIVNASIRREEWRHRLLDRLDDLQEKYGELPSILATRADYIEDVDEKVTLFRRAYALATERGDSFNQLEIADSLATLYIVNLKDAAKGWHWLERMRRHMDERSDWSHDQDYESLREALSKLPPSDTPPFRTWPFGMG